MELAIVESIRARLPSHPQLLLGVGDDAAVLRLTERADCVVTTDLLAEGTHFRLAEVSPQRVGRKALACNLSDLAAMAARPVAAVVSLLLPLQDAIELAGALYDGMLPLAEEFNTAIAGGDTNCWDGPLVISITACGETTTRGPLRRDGARPGDVILVTGMLGGSRVAKQFDFSPRVREALLLHEQFDLRAGMDISDGLLLDLDRMCRASGCGAVLNVDAVPVAADARRWAELSASGLSPRQHALQDGEDFELLLATSPAGAQEIVARQPVACGVTNIGRFVSTPGLWQEARDGTLISLAPRGYQHGA